MISTIRFHGGRYDPTAPLLRRAIAIIQQLVLAGAISRRKKIRPRTGQGRMIVKHRIRSTGSGQS
jgi:hypothetical protein